MVVYAVRRVCSLLVFSFCSAFVLAEPINVFAPNLPSSCEVDGKGRDLEIVSAVLKHCGYQPEFTLLPFGRHVRNFEHGQMGDGVITVPASQAVEGFSSNPYIWYQNGVSYLETNIPEPHSIEDLHGLRVMTFIGGTDVLDLNDSVDDFGDFSEHPNQRVHTAMLYYDRVDAVLSDGLIFSSINTRLRQDESFSSRIDMERNLKFAPIFEPTPFKAVFREEQLSADFNRCYRELDEAGVVEAINVKYVNPHREVLEHGYLGF